MIKNIPTSRQFEVLGLQCISKAFEMVYKLGLDYAEIVEDPIVNEEVPEDVYWGHHAITVQTSLIVLFQGIEYLMKSEITKHSAILLIENSRNDWPSLPEKSDKDFDELITISGENLLSVFAAVVSSDFKLKEFVKEIKDLRVKRNKLVHSTGINDLSYKYVVKGTLSFLSYFYKKDYWISLFREMLTSEPTFGYWDADIEASNFYTLLDFVEASLTRSEFNNYLINDIKSRRYCCPECTYWITKHDNSSEIPKWAFLSPNSPTATKLDCLICGKQYDVERSKCNNDSCKGNVIGQGDYQCLTCNRSLIT